MRGARAAVLVAAVALGAAGCGGDGSGGGLEIGGPEDARAAVAAAADVADAASSSSFTIELVSTAPGVPEYSGEGSFLADGTGRLTMELDGVSIESLFVADAIYFSSDVFAGVVDTPWVTVDLDVLSDSAGVDLEALVGGGGDPTAALDQLRGAGEVAEIGTEEVRGVTTTRFHAVVDLHDAIAAAPEDQREALEQLLEQAETLLDSSVVEVDVWIDAEGRPARMTQLTELAGGHTTVTMELFDWGVPVDLTPPPADEVTDITDLVGG
jgi:hypothetical protein